MESTRTELQTLNVTHEVTFGTLTSKTCISSKKLLNNSTSIVVIAIHLNDS